MYETATAQWQAPGLAMRLAGAGGSSGGRGAWACALHDQPGQLPEDDVQGEDDDGAVQEAEAQHGHSRRSGGAGRGTLQTRSR